jgi:nitroreductase
MDAFECIVTKLDVREFEQRAVPAEVIFRVLEAARLTGSGRNAQHWRFILVRKRENLEALARDSTTGKWVAGASFAVIVLTDPSLPFHQIDAGRAVQDMQLAAWNHGVASCLFTGIRQEALRRDFNIPGHLQATAVVGFGYPLRPLRGRKNRRPLRELAFSEAYGNPLALPEAQREAHEEGGR